MTEKTSDIPAIRLQRDDGARIHRRETMRQLVLPMGLALLFIIAIGAVVVILSDPTRISVVSSWMVLVLFLCPSVLIAAALFVGLTLLVYGINRLHSGAGSALQRAERFVDGAAERVLSISRRLGRSTIRYSESTAPLVERFKVYEKDGSDRL